MAMEGSENKRFESYVIQEMPEVSGCHIWMQVKRKTSIFTQEESFEFNHYITTEPRIVKTIWKAWQPDKSPNKEFEAITKTVFARMRDISRIDMLVSPLDKDKYLPLDESGTKFETMLLSCAMYKDDGGEPVACLGIPDMMQIAAMFGWAPPMTMQIPLSVIHLLNDGKVDEALSALSWLKEKPGQLLLADVRPTYVLRDLAPRCASYAISEEFLIK